MVGVPPQFARSVQSFGEERSTENRCIKLSTIDASAICPDRQVLRENVCGDCRGDKKKTGHDGFLRMCQASFSLSRLSRLSNASWTVLLCTLEAD